MSPSAARQPAARMVETTPTDYWNDSCAVDDLAYAVERGATGATSNPVIVGEVMKKELGALGPARPRAGGRAPDLVRGRAHLGADRGDGRARRGDPRPGVRARGRAQGPPVAADEPGQPPRRRRGWSSRPSTSTRLAPNIQVKFPTTAAGLSAIEEATARGVVINATVAFTVPQAIAVGEAVDRGLGAVRGGGRRHQPVQPGLLADDRAARRLGEGPRGARRHRPRSRRRQLGGHRGVQARVRHLPGAWLPDPAAGGRLSPPPALDRARRRRHRADDDARLAGAVQRERHRPRPAHRRARRPRDPRRAVRARARLPSRLRAGRPDATPSSRATARRRGRCARSSPATTT